MSSEPETNNPASPSASRESLDLTGLPAPVADELKKAEPGLVPYLR